jgi:cyanobactin biosynthesis protein (PatB/AcyB/McaB family)
MRLPIQAKPVKRPELIQPHTTVDVEYGDAEDLVSIRSRLTHGANYNDPPALRMPKYDRMKLTCFTCPVPGWF